MCENQHCEIIFFEILKPSQSFLKMKKMKLKNRDKSYTLLKTHIQWLSLEPEPSCPPEDARTASEALRQWETMCCKVSNDPA
jgi:hypothetical protein